MRRDAATLFDDVAAGAGRTVVRLSRPFDIAPDGGTRYEAADLARLVHEAAGWLLAAGVRRGDRVAIVKRNHWDYDLLAFAAVRVGAVPAKLSGHLPAGTLRTLLKRLEPALLVTSAGIVAGARAEGVDLAAFATRMLSLDGTVQGGLSIEDVAGYREAPVRRGTDRDGPLLIVHTSGTTGTPKLVVHSHATMLDRLAAIEARPWPVLSCGRDDVLANASAYAHGRTFCWTVSAAMTGRPRELVVLADHGPGEALPVLAAHPPTVLEALPATYVGWRGALAGPEHPFRDVRLFVSTYDAMHPPVVRAYLTGSRRRYPLWLQGWGQSETGPLTFRFLTRRALRHTGERHPTTRDVGRPVPGRTRLRVVDPETFAPVPRGRAGLVLARTATCCLGYVGEDDRFATKLRDGWFATGDLGVRRRDGALLLLDREVDRVPGASCVELEDVIEDRLADVVECVIIGVAGRVPLPVLATATGWLDPAAWRDAVADLPPLDTPVVLHPEDLPRTGTGKVRRGQLRAWLSDGGDPVGTGRWT